MNEVDFLILGGGIAGVTAAETLWEKGAGEKIAILENEPHVLYSRVMIPRYLKGKVRREELFLRKIDDYEKKNINFFPLTNIIEINPKEHKVAADDGRVFHYKKLLIASGGKPSPLPEVFNYPGETKILRMHTLEDADFIKKSMEEASEKTILVVGEGFIALEFISVFVESGFKVHVIARGDIWGQKRFGAAGGGILEENFKKYGIIIHTKTDVAFFKEGEWYLKNAHKIKTQLIGAGIGLGRNLVLFNSLKFQRGVLTNEYLETSDPDIYAAGDIAEFFDVISGKPQLVGNWTNSFLQGRVAALNMLASSSTGQSGLGQKTIFKNVSAYNMTKLEMKLTFLGDVSDFSEVFEKTDSPEKFGSEKTLLRALFRGGKITGAVLINRFNDKILLAELIEKGALKNELEKTFT